MWTESEIADIATDAAADAASEYDVEALEGRLAELERENRELRDDVDSHGRMIQELYDNQQATADYINSMR